MKKAIIIFEGHILLDEEDNNCIFCDIFCSILTCLMRLMKFMNGSMFIASKLSRLCAEFLKFFILFQTYCNIYIQPYMPIEILKKMMIQENRQIKVTFCKRSSQFLFSTAQQTKLTLVILTCVGFGSQCSIAGYYID